MQKAQKLVIFKRQRLSSKQRLIVLKLIVKSKMKQARINSFKKPQLNFRNKYLKDENKAKSTFRNFSIEVRKTKFLVKCKRKKSYVV